MDAVGTVLVGLAVVVGLAGIVLPVLPGLWLIWLAVAVWGVAAGGVRGWTVVVVATLVACAGTVLKYLLPGRRLKESGVPRRTTGAGLVLGVIGFFVVPVVGLFLGFVLGIFLAELARLRDAALAWPSTRRALALVGWSILIELAAGLLVTATWGLGVAAAAG